MAKSVFPRQYKDGTMWVAEVRNKRVPYLREKFARKAEAIAFAELGQARLDKELEEARDPKASLPPSGQLEDEKLRHTMKLYVKSDSCIDSQRMHIQSMLRLAGNPRLGDFTRPWIKRFIASARSNETYRGEPYAYTTIHKFLILIRIALRWRAEELRMETPRFPYTEKMLPEGWDIRRDRRLEDHEHRAIVRHFREMTGPTKRHWRLLFLLAIETCARQQELVRAEWSEFDPLLRFWDIPAEHTKKNTARRMVLTPKAKRIMAALRLLAAPGSPRVFHVFSTAAVVSNSFHRSMVQAGIEDFRFHDLRHIGISKFVVTQPKFKVEVIMKMVGHRSMDTFQRYLNLRGDELAEMLV